MGNPTESNTVDIRKPIVQVSLLAFWKPEWLRFVSQHQMLLTGRLDGTLQ